MWKVLQILIYKHNLYISCMLIIPEDSSQFAKKEIGAMQLNRDFKRMEIY